MRDDFTSISPSARSLLFMKALAGIPFAREAAQVIWGPGLDQALEQASDYRFLMLLSHFENRYRTVDELARDSGYSAFMEVSSGYSFRALDFARDPLVRYIDTDLPELIATKRAILELMAESNPGLRDARVELEALNALDVKRFASLVARFGDSSLCILNEGLLVYLDEEEKRALCSNVRAALMSQGGCWITGDIYVRDERLSLLGLDGSAARFRSAHRIEENKFDDFEAAESFFASCGLKVTGKKTRAVAPLRATAILEDFARREGRSPDEPAAQRTPGRPSRETWKLEPA